MRLSLRAALDARKSIGHGFFCDGAVTVCLQAGPEACTGAEKARQAQIGDDRDRDRASATDRQY